MNQSYLKSKITEGFRSIFERFHSPFINGADYLPFTNLLQNFGIISRLSALGETHNNFSNRVPANQAKVAEKYPIHELAFQNVPRHFFFLGEKAVDEKSLAITRKFGEIPKPSGISFGSHLRGSPKNPEKEELKKLIKKSIIKNLNLNEDLELGDSENLVDIGLDSFLGVELLFDLQNEIGFPLHLTHVFHHQTICDIANSIHAQFNQ